MSAFDTDVPAVSVPSKRDLGIKTGKSSSSGSGANTVRSAGVSKISAMDTGTAMKAENNKRGGDDNSNAKGSPEEKKAREAEDLAEKWAADADAGIFASTSKGSSSSTAVALVAAATPPSAVLPLILSLDNAPAAPAPQAPQESS